MTNNPLSGKVKRILIIFLNFIIFHSLFFSYLKNPIYPLDFGESYNFFFIINFFLAIIATFSIKAYYLMTFNDDLYMIFLFFLSITIELGVKVMSYPYFMLDESCMFLKTINLRTILLILILFREFKIVKSFMNFIKSNKWIFISATVLCIIFDLAKVGSAINIEKFRQIIALIVVTITIFSVLYNMKNAGSYKDSISSIMSISFLFITISHMYRLAPYIFNISDYKGENIIVEQIVLFLAIIFIILGIIIQVYALINQNNLTNEKYNLFFNMVNENEHDKVFIYKNSKLIYANKKAKKEVIKNENIDDITNICTKINSSLSYEKICEIENIVKEKDSENMLITLENKRIYAINYQKIKPLNEKINNDDIKVFMSRDITKEIENDKEKSINNKKFSLINDNVDEFIFIVDDKFNINYINRQCEKILNISCEEAFGKSILEYINIEKYIDKLNAKIDLVVNGNEIKNIQIKLDKLIDDDDNIIGYVVICQDWLKAKNFNLNNDVNNTRDSFANLSHELRTPIHIIYSSLQLLNTQKNSTNIDEFKKAFDKYESVMRINSMRLLKLINDIIDINKLDNGYVLCNKKVYNIVALIENIADSVIPYMKTKNINFIFDTEEEERYIECDQEKIERIFLNLISNAVKFTEENGEISIKIYFTLEWIEIHIKDNGVGISEKNIDKIFDRYVQDGVPSSNSKGSGIGLSLVKSLVEMHEGKITVKSEMGKGSEFIVYLPNVTDEQNYKYMNEESLETTFLGDISVEFSNVEM